MNSMFAESFVDFFQWSVNGLFGQTELGNVRFDIPTTILVVAVISFQAIFLVIGRVLKRQPENLVDPAIIRTFNRRITAWIVITAVLALSFLVGRVFVVVLFGLASFWALREFITMTPTRRGDHRTLFWVFFLFTPLQYVLLGFGRNYTGMGLTDFDFYAIYSIMIPVYGSLFIPARIAFSGDSKRFLERTAKIQFGLLICVYALSYAPALLDLDLQQYDPSTKKKVDWEGSHAGLLFYFIVIVQISDSLQYLCDKLLGKHVIAPEINATKTWEGLIGGALGSSIIGALIALIVGVTPFTTWGAGAMSLIITVMGAAGTMAMSAIKRDRGVKDYGTLVQGHAGVLDRVDSICFAAPVFFHVTRFYLEKS